MSFGRSDTSVDGVRLGRDKSEIICGLGRRGEGTAFNKLDSMLFALFFENQEYSYS